MLVKVKKKKKKTALWSSIFFLKKCIEKEKGHNTKLRLEFKAHNFKTLPVLKIYAA